MNLLVRVVALLWTCCAAHPALASDWIFEETKDRLTDAVKRSSTLGGGSADEQ